MGDGDDTLYSEAGLSTNINVYDGLLDMGSGNDAIYIISFKLYLDWRFN